MAHDANAHLDTAAADSGVLSQYQKESEKGAGSGYASLGVDSLVPQDQLGTGTQDGTKFLRDDGTWQAAGGGTSTIRVPIDLRNPRVTSIAGNAFFTVEGLTAWDIGRWEFVKDFEGKIYGVVAIPKNVHATPNAKIILSIGANATTGNTQLQVRTKAIADGESMNPSAFTDETAQTITVPGTARFRKDVTFPTSGSLGETVAADDLLLVEVFHDGDHASDTLNAATELYAAFLEIDVA